MLIISLLWKRMLEKKPSNVPSFKQSREADKEMLPGNLTSGLTCPPVRLLAGGLFLEGVRF